MDAVEHGLLAPGKLMVEPGNGEGCVTVEQDMYPLQSFDDPFPIAQRTNQYLRRIM